MSGLVFWCTYTNHDGIGKQSLEWDRHGCVVPPLRTFDKRVMCRGLCSSICGPLVVRPRQLALRGRSRLYRSQILN